MYRTFFPRDLFTELDRLQREFQRSLEFSPSIRGNGCGGFPAINIGSTSESVEIFAFAPGLNPDSIEINLDRGVLSISGESPNDLPKQDAKQTTHINERFSGRFRRVVSLPDNIDPSTVTAKYSDGVLHISAKRQQSTLPRRITIQ